MDSSAELLKNVQDTSPPASSVCESMCFQTLQCSSSTSEVLAVSLGACPGFYCCASSHACCGCLCLHADGEAIFPCQRAQLLVQYRTGFPLPALEEMGMDCALESFLVEERMISAGSGILI